MQKTELWIATARGMMPEDAWLPFGDAEFAAHKQEKDGDWKVSHVRTGLAIPHTQCPTRKRALELATTLSAHCPTAALIEPTGTPGVIRGPKDRMVAEIKRALGLDTAE